MTLEAFALRTQTNDERKEKLQHNAEITKVQETKQFATKLGDLKHKAATIHIG
jgi:hypothetical protein